MQIYIEFHENDRNIIDITSLYKQIFTSKNCVNTIIGSYCANLCRISRKSLGTFARVTKKNHAAQFIDRWNTDLVSRIPSAPASRARPTRTASGPDPSGRRHLQKKSTTVTVHRTHPIRLCHVTSPYADLELVAVQVFHIAAQEAVQHLGDDGLENHLRRRLLPPGVAGMGALRGTVTIKRYYKQW